MKKGGSDNTLMWIALVVIGASALGIINLGTLFSSASTGDGGGGTTGGVVTTCDTTTTPEWDPNAYDINNPGTPLVETTNLYKKVGDTSWTAFTQGTSPGALRVNSDYEYVFGIGLSDFTDNAYGPHGTFNSGCLEDVDFTDTALYDDSIETALTATFYNADDSAAAETFTAGQVQTVFIQWEAGNDDVCGNPYIRTDPKMSDKGSWSKEYPNVVCIPLNSSAWEAPQDVYIARANEFSSVGDRLDRIAQPIRHGATANNVTYCYEFPVVSDTPVRVAFKMEADSATPPVTDQVASLYCGNYYLEFDTGQLMWGVETNNQTAVGTDAADVLVLDFSA